MGETASLPSRKSYGLALTLTVLLWAVLCSNKPAVEKLENDHVYHNVVHLVALHLFGRAISGSRLAIVVTINGVGLFENANDPARAVIFGPRLIEMTWMRLLGRQSLSRCLADEDQGRKGAPRPPYHGCAY